jgi:DNA-binding transcriptional regulator YhcF (GntR family)
VADVLISVDPADPTPPYVQIRTPFADLVRSGALAAGSRLPTVRRLADDLGVAPGTVARAYRTLEIDAVTETRGRAGTFVSVGTDRVAREAFALAVEYASRIRRLGLDRTDAHLHIDTAFDASEPAGDRT